jgi:hypothetical protein
MQSGDGEADVDTVHLLHPLAPKGIPMRLTAEQLATVTGWTKSGRSGAAGHCVEVAPFADGFALRDSNAPQDGAQFFTKGDIAAFVSGARDGDFDHLLA